VPIGLDARIYYRGVANWLAGIDPWRADVVFNHHTFSYAGTPATTVLLAPAGLISEDAFVVLALALTAAAALWIVRRLDLSLWWLLFPPVSEVLFSANPQVVVLGLLLARGTVASAVATALKAYAAVPLLAERRIRAAVAGFVLTAATMIAAPSLWLSYLREFGTISARLAHQSDRGFSAFYYPLLAVPVAVLLLLLARRDRRAAGWLAVPALWPASEFHYSTFALPVMSPLLAFVLAIPSQQLPPVAVALDAIRRLARPWVGRRTAATRAGIVARHTPATEP
jgi:hypothetical protein